MKTHKTECKTDNLRQCLANSWHLQGVMILTAVAVSTFFSLHFSPVAVSMVQPSIVLANNEAAPPSTTTEKQPSLPQHSSVSNQTQHPAIEPSTEYPWRSFRIKHGQDLSNLGEIAGIPEDEIEAVRSGKYGTYLQNLYPGDRIRLQVTRDGHLAALEYDIHDSRRLLVVRKGTDDSGNPVFQSTLIDRPLEVRMAYASGVIRHSLFHSGKRSGLSTPLIMELAAIFGWDIGFARDIKKGDNFAIVYEQHFRGGEKVADGPILAAKFINDGRTHQAIRYTTPDGKSEFYTPEGSSLRKPFLRNPVDSAVISSKFDLNRRHPILSTIRAHRGVDYAADVGTPIKATGDGHIIFRGKKNGYGNTIIIQHDKRRSTLYAHMLKFAKYTRTGRKVRQGQIIGYVGKSGWATGPHLHYEFRVDGEHVDPLKLQHAYAQVPEELQDDFLTKTKTLLTQLDNPAENGNILALSESDETADL
jgi:murein DD-endopeptidase MepM/ murein hydrolase activator NlpD